MDFRLGKVIKDRRKLHNYFYHITVIKSRRLSAVGYVAYMAEKRTVYTILLRNTNTADVVVVGKINRQ